MVTSSSPARAQGVGVGHGGHPLGVGEAGDLDPPHAGGDQAVDQIEFGERVQHRGLVLQPVARRHVDQVDDGGQAVGSLCNHRFSDHRPPPRARFTTTI
jgi:hypothetical protein